MTLFHGGVPGLRIGERIEPGHERLAHPGCKWCEARAQGGAYLGMDGPSWHADKTYSTTSRLYAKHYASLWGYGDLYRVSLIGEGEPSLEDSMPSMISPALRVEAVLDRAVRLTPSERRKLTREWDAADAIFAKRGTP